MRGHETNPLQTGNPISLLQKAGKIMDLTGASTIRIHILAQQCNFFKPSCSQLFHFSDDIPTIATAFPTSGIRNNTITAKIVAAIHNVNKRTNSLPPRGGQVFNDLTVLIPDFQDLFFSCLESFQQQRQLVQVMGTKNNVYPFA